MTGIVFVSYFALLAYLLAGRSRMLFPSVAVPTVGFVLVSALRIVCGRMRPYERFGLPPVIPKKTKGKSFPSRHVFSAAIIAATFLVQSEPFLAVAGIVLALLALLLGVLRVVSGVHYISDVAAALVCAGIGWASYGIWL